MHEETKHITELILEAAAKAREETSHEQEPQLTQPAEWPIDCKIGQGLAGAIACETKIGYVNGTKGWLVYQGHDIFDLCAYSTYEEVSYLLLHGKLPNASELTNFKRTLAHYRMLPKTISLLMRYSLDGMRPMAALRLGTNLMRQTWTSLDKEAGRPDSETTIPTDDDTVPSEPEVASSAQSAPADPPAEPKHSLRDEQGASLDACCHLLAGVGAITASICRLQADRLPIEPDPDLGHAANLLYMMTGKKPTPEEERIMDVALILHADHGMNASTFAAMVVASTLADFYFSVGAGVGALSGPLHGGANEEVLKMLNEIGSAERVPDWFGKARAEKRKIMGFGHRVYKAYDPRARVLGPLAEFLAEKTPSAQPLIKTAKALEDQVIETLGKEKKIFPNVDFYSGLVYHCMGIPSQMFTPMFAVSRVAGWTARVREYVQSNRIFRPRAVYTGDFNKKYVPMEDR